MNGNIVIVGDFNIDWLNPNGSERKQYCNILETFGFVQNICTETRLSLVRIVILYQTSVSRTLFPIK